MQAFKHMDTSLLGVDVQPNYVRVTLKGKHLQIAFDNEVRPDASVAKRSQTTGDLVITMPRLKPYVRASREDVGMRGKEAKVEKGPKTEYLEVESKRSVKEELASIVAENEKRGVGEAKMGERRKRVEARENSPDFKDDLEVPPLE